MASRPDVMLGMTLPDVDLWSDRVCVALGQNPGVFTGPGTNTYLVGTGRNRILLDTGDGTPAYLPVLEQALERVGCGIQEIVLTHGHPDHIGGARDVLDRHSGVTISKMPWPRWDDSHGVPITSIEDGSVVRTEGATLRAVHTPGHAEDHLCFMLEEERSLFSGDNVLGVGTTVIPAETGSLLDYMRSLDRLLGEEPTTIYPAHGPRIDDGVGKIRQYIGHRQDRERQILEALRSGASNVTEVVKIVYAAYPESLHAAAGQSVCAHLKKLEDESRVNRDGDSPLEARWTIS